MSHDNHRFILTDIKRIASRYKRANTIAQSLKTIEGNAINTENKPITIGVVGAFSRGKSSLINVLLGMDVLPASVLPETALPTRLVYGTEAKLHALSTGRRVFTDNVSSIKQFSASIAMADNHVDTLVLEINSQLLADGIILIDTPGIGAVYSEHYNKTKAILIECDAVIFVFSTDPLLSEVECKFVEELITLSEIILFVQTKIDIFDDWYQKLQYNTMVLQHLLQPRKIKVFPLSCVDGLPNDISSKAYLTSRNNLDNLLRELRKLADERENILESRNVFLAQKLAEKLNKYLPKKIKQLKENIIKLELDLNKIRDRRVDLTKTQQKLGEKLKDINGKINGSITAEAENAVKNFSNEVIVDYLLDEKHLKTVLIRELNKMNGSIRKKIQQETRSFIKKNILSDKSWLPTNNFPEQENVQFEFEKLYINKPGDKTGWGAIIGGGLGTVIFPGLGTAAGVAIGAFIGNKIKNELILNTDGMKNNIINLGSGVVEKRKRILADYWRKEVQIYRSFSEAELGDTQKEIENDERITANKLRKTKLRHKNAEKDRNVIREIIKGGK